MKSIAPDLDSFKGAEAPTSFKTQSFDQIFKVESKQVQQKVSKDFNQKIQKQAKVLENQRTKLTVNKPASEDSPQLDRDPDPIFLESLGGISYLLQQIDDLIVKPLTLPLKFKQFNANPPTGVLLVGPTGCGKTSLAHAIANHVNQKIQELSRGVTPTLQKQGSSFVQSKVPTKVTFFPVDAPQLITSKTGESEEILRNLFRLAIEKAPSLIFIDQIDIIAIRNDSATREFEKRITAQLSTCLDNLTGLSVMVLAATSRVTQLEPSLRRPGRFDSELEIGIPNKGQRVDIIKKLLKLDHDFASELSQLTPGYVPADFQQLLRAAATEAINRNDETLQISHFQKALKNVQPTSKREGFSAVPEFSLDRIGGLTEVKKLLDLWVIRPIQKPEIYQRLGMSVSSGIILFGAPGNGKSLLGRAIAGQSECNFLSVKGPELLNQYVGESERAVRQLFARARAARPCVLFLDECECLCRRRGLGNNSEVTDRVVNQFLTELDGVSGASENVFVIGATNRADLLDPAITRPGRLEKAIYVPLPDQEGRVDIIKKMIQFMPHNLTDEQLQVVVSDMDGYTGADLQALVREAGLKVVEREGEGLKFDDFMSVKGQVRRSVDDKDLAHYKQLEAQFKKK